MAVYMSDELREPEEARTGFACDFTCPTHGRVYDVEEMQREGMQSFVHRGCGDVVIEDWLF